MKESEAKEKFCPIQRPNLPVAPKCVGSACMMWEADTLTEKKEIETPVSNLGSREETPQVYVEPPEGDGWEEAKGSRSARRIHNNIYGDTSYIITSTWWREVVTDTGDCGLKTKGE